MKRITPSVDERFPPVLLSVPPETILNVSPLPAENIPDVKDNVGTEVPLFVSVTMLLLLLPLLLMIKDPVDNDGNPLPVSWFTEPL
jgi:hypothetical protein